MAYVRKRGNKWQGLYDRNGRQRSAGVHDTEKEARRAAMAAELGPDRGPKSKWTFKDYAEEWMDTLNVEKGTKLLHDWALELHILPTFSKIKLADIEVSDVRSWAGKLVKKGLAPRTQRIVWSTLHPIVEQAVEDDIIPLNPARTSIKKKVLSKQVKKKNTYVTPEQLYALADVIAPRWKAVILVMGMCGLRFGEVAGLRYEHLHLDELHPRIEVVGAMKEHSGAVYYEERTKTGAKHDVLIPKPLVPILKTHLKKYSKNPEFVFCGSRGGVMRRNWNLKVFKPAAAKIGMPKLRPHDLRHTCVAILLEAGVSFHDVAEWVGHQGIRTTMMYGGGYDNLERTADVLSGVFEAIPSGNGQAKPAVATLVK